MDTTLVNLRTIIEYPTNCVTPQNSCHWINRLYRSPKSFGNVLFILIQTQAIGGTLSVTYRFLNGSFFIQIKNDIDNFFLLVMYIRVKPNTLKNGTNESLMACISPKEQTVCHELRRSLISAWIYQRKKSIGLIICTGVCHFDESGIDHQ